MRAPHKNPFVSNALRKAFDGAVKAYDTRANDLTTPDGKPRRGNSWATSFWRGFDGVGPYHWDAQSRASTGFAFFRAGQYVAWRESADMTEKES